MNINLKIEGMMCQGCVNRVNNVLASIKGVKEYKVSLENKSADITIKNEKVIDEIKEKIESLGFRCE